MKLFAYGNAHNTKSENGTYIFTCEHGPNECAANLFEVCFWPVPILTVHVTKDQSLLEVNEVVSTSLAGGSLTQV